jgi:hypothetical protein
MQAWHMFPSHGMPWNQIGSLVTRKKIENYLKLHLLINKIRKKSFEMIIFSVFLIYDYYNLYIPIQYVLFCWVDKLSYNSHLSFLDP